MDKLKQIEENSKELYNDLSSIMSEEYEKRLLITPNYCANKILEKGYRKIPEGAVVLTDKKDIQQFEWSKMLDRMGMFKLIDKIREETAKEIFDKIFFYRNRKDTTNFDTILLNMAKDYNVEVE